MAGFSLVTSLPTDMGTTVAWRRVGGIAGMLDVEATAYVGDSYAWILD